MPGLANFPPEVLNDLLKQAKLSSITSFKNCLVVNKAWNELGTKILYCDVVITVRNMQHFTHHFNRNYTPLVRSLTVRIDGRDQGGTAVTEGSSDDGNEEARNNPSNGTGETSRPAQNGVVDVETDPSLLGILYTGSQSSYGQDLAILTKILPTLRRLESFSFTARWTSYLSVGRPLLDAICQKLPESCTSFEIDVDFWGDFWLASLVYHPCPLLRAILPRMKHVRIRLPKMCADLLLEDPKPKSARGTDMETVEERTPVELPHVRSIMINCSAYNCYFPHRPDMLVPSTSPTHMAWGAIATAIQRLVNGKKHPATAKVLVWDYYGTHACAYGTFFCADMRSEITRVFSHVDIILNIAHRFFLRTADGKDFFGTADAVMNFSEGQVWKTMVGGARVASASLKETQPYPAIREPAGLSMISVEAWEALYQRQYSLLRTEREQGIKILRPEVRKGKKKFLSRMPVVEGGQSGQESQQ